METLTELFNLGMLRDYPEILPDREGVVLNLGAGNKTIKGTIGLDLPRWNAEEDNIPFKDDSVGMIHCYHFLEHIENTYWLIKEIRRVLIPGGHVNIVVPYYSSAMQAQDLDHKHSFTEKTFKHLFNIEYYQKGKVSPMEICTNFIMGDCEANLCLVVQLRKPL